MATLAGSVTVNPITGVATGSGMALALYNVMLASATYSGIAVDPTVGMTTARVAQARIQLAEICNSFAVIADGPQWLPTAVKTSAYTAAPWEYVKCNPTGGGFTVSLPNPTTVPVGVAIRTKNVSNSTNVITIVAVGGSLIDGFFASINQVNGIACTEFVSDGTNWFISAAYND